MNLSILVAGGVLALAGTMLAADAVDAKAAPKTDREKASYSIGISLGSSWKKNSLDLDVDMVAKGIKDGMSGGAAAMTEDEVKEALNSFQNQMMAKQQEKAKVLGEKNKKDGETYLAENKKKDGVKTTASGLQYKVIKEGTGAVPKAENTVKTNYKGTLIDGTEFDSSYKRGEPAEFPVNGVIKGWTEALQMMKVGSKYQLFIPSELAYGEQGAGNVIGPNAVLVFEIELLEIVP